MTNRALISKRTVVRIIISVAGGTVHGRAFELAVLMTVLTGNRGMFPVQFEREFGMIYLRQIPAIGGVTSGAFGSELTVVMVVFQMAGDTRLRSGFQVPDCARSNMTLGAGDRRVFAAQLERDHIMVKVRAKRFLTIVTSHTVCAECDEVFRGKCLVDLQVTVTACVLIKWRSITFYMAFLTSDTLM